MTAKAQDEPPIVLSGDRTIIYIDRLPLRGDETLMDVLLMYPEQMVQGFDDLLESYQLRMENVPVSLDIRHRCARIRECRKELPDWAELSTLLCGATKRVYMVWPV